MAASNGGDANSTAAGSAAAPVTEEPLEKAKTEADLVDHAQTEEHRRTLAMISTDVKIPTDLSKVSDAKARELSEAGIVDDADLPAKMYRRKVDGFMARIPNYTFNAYSKDLQEEWEEVKLTSDAPAAE